MAQVALKVGRNDPCPCGSGKKFKHCCGTLPHGRGAHTDLTSLLREAFNLQQQGQAGLAAGIYRQVLQIQPRHPEAHYLLGFIEYQAGNLTPAADLMGKALGLGLTDAAAHYHYAMVLLQLRRAAEAIVQLQLALAKKPDFDDARVNLANIYFELGSLNEAERLYRETLVRQPENWKAYHNLAHVFYYLGNIDGAIRYFEQAIQIVPRYAEAHASLATMLEVNNQPEEAEREALRALELQPGNASASVVIAKLLRRRQKPGEALAALDSIDFDTATQRTLITLWNERGQNLDRLGRYQEAYDAFAQSNNTLAAFRGRPYSKSDREQPLDEAETYFTPAKAASLAKALCHPPGSPLPVFVVGFLRSGTTLVEQILSSHRDIAAAGELEFTLQIEQGLVDRQGNTYPRSLDGLVTDGDGAALIAARERYLGQLAALGDYSGKKWVVDKLPFNMLHLPLIRLLFPESPIIHVVRHPLDTVLSCFSQIFLHEHEWSYTVHDAAELYVRSVRHVERMKEVLDLRYMQIRYEDLVAGPQTEVRSLLSFVGVDWDPDCLKFYENKRVARTASYEQVTRQLYSSSVNRYLNYIDMIDEETLSLLEPAIVSLGYELKRSKNAVS